MNILQNNNSKYVIKDIIVEFCSDEFFFKIESEKNLYEVIFNTVAIIDNFHYLYLGDVIPDAQLAIKAFEKIFETKLSEEEVIDFYQKNESIQQIQT